MSPACIQDTQKSRLGLAEWEGVSKRSTRFPLAPFSRRAGEGGDAKGYLVLDFFFLESLVVAAPGVLTSS